MRVRGQLAQTSHTNSKQLYHKALLLIRWSPAAVHLSVIDRLGSIQYRFLLCLRKQGWKVKEPAHAVIFVQQAADSLAEGLTPAVVGDMQGSELAVVFDFCFGCDWLNSP